MKSKAGVFACNVFGPNPTLGNVMAAHRLLAAIDAYRSQLRKLVFDIEDRNVSVADYEETHRRRQVATLAAELLDVTLFPDDLYATPEAVRLADGRDIPLDPCAKLTGVRP